MGYLFLSFLAKKVKKLNMNYWIFLLKFFQNQTIKAKSKEFQQKLQRQSWYLNATITNFIKTHAL